MSDLKNIDSEELKSRLISIKEKYKILIEEIAPKLQKAANLEKEIDLLLSELKSRT